MAHIRQPRPDYGLGFQVKVLKRFKLFPLRSEADLALLVLLGSNALHQCFLVVLERILGQSARGVEGLGFTI